MSNHDDLLQQALKNARQAYQSGNHLNARHWAQRAAEIAPDREDVWLWLAAVSPPRASVEYMRRALQIAPKSERARKGMHWALRRMREATPLPEHPITPSHTPSPLYTSPPTTGLVSRSRGLQFTYLHWALILMIVSLLLVAVSLQPLQTVFESRAYAQSLPRMISELQKASDTPTPTFTPTVTASPTSLPTDTPTVTPSDTPTLTPTDTPIPPPTDTPVPYDPMPVDLPDVNRHERWIDVDLTQQQLYAYEGSQPVQSFIVSTGTWEHPTVTGQYYIYVKYEAAPMSGPGYYLPGVPYIMYFYKGYGLHGTYWHNNFGTPMSHGCVNLRTEDAEWLFYWASVGTLVNIHY